MPVIQVYQSPIDNSVVPPGLLNTGRFLGCFLVCDHVVVRGIAPFRKGGIGSARCRRPLHVPIDPVIDGTNASGVATSFESDNIKPFSRLGFEEETSLAPCDELAPEKSAFE